MVWKFLGFLFSRVEKNCKTHYIGAKWSKFLHVGGIWNTFLLEYLNICIFLNFRYSNTCIFAYLHTTRFAFLLACFYKDCWSFVKCFNWIPLNLYDSSCVRATWTKVTLTNVAWTIVVGKCNLCKWSQDSYKLVWQVWSRSNQ